MSKDKEQIAFRVTPQMKREIDLIMDSDGSRTRNEFLEHAVKFYIDHLLARDMSTLPVSVTSAIDGRLGMLEDRLSALQFNNSVELDMLVRIIAGQYDLSPGYLRKFRSESVKNVKQTSGRVSQANAMKESDEVNGRADSEVAVHQSCRRREVHEVKLPKCRYWQKKLFFWQKEKQKTVL